jgi:hypothetical protein
MIVNGNAEVIEDGLLQQFHPTEIDGRVKAAHDPVGHIDIQIARQGDHRRGLGLAIDGDNDHRIGPRPTRRVRIDVLAQQQDVGRA